MESTKKKASAPTPDSSFPTNRVLLLEDDRQFATILKNFLESNFFEVVAVSNGVEGVREIMAGDFGVIICDMMMPRLPGNMFYFAVERLKPNLCHRFIFITGHQASGKVSEFIKLVKGTILSKPFRLDDLIEAIEYLQLRCKNLRA